MSSDTLLTLRAGDVGQVVKIPPSTDLIGFTHLCTQLGITRMSLHGPITVYYLTVRSQYWPHFLCSAANQLVKTPKSNKGKKTESATRFSCCSICSCETLTSESPNDHLPAAATCFFMFQSFLVAALHCKIVCKPAWGCVQLASSWSG